ncbi:uncharacterized protein GIQ15_06441 [Arthroderma uncinatum]|uniref:uncharacterized protein n=1 Tax=Arthroderma uncinatum TaxID=74035 RepID=UPI00144A54A4|nr:uncharacterized protein GIQ15_06441 [Arthroderma uncinatum]KAF3479465.1 hypothetical protein GIQ15_06441 [Arthroderma uncinatum]
MSSETSRGFTTEANQGVGGRGGSAGVGATAPTGRGVGGAAKESAHGVGHGVKSAVAGVHGMGEKIRGAAGATIDRAMDHPEGVAKNDQTIREGEREMKTGDFNGTTREREGLPHSERASHNEQMLHSEQAPHGERAMHTQNTANAQPPADY